MRRKSFSLLLLLLTALLAVPADAATRRVRLDDGTVAALADAKEIFLEAAPLQGEGFYAFCRRFTGTRDTYPEVRKVNGNPRRLLAGVRYKVPFKLLTDERQLQVVRALFPDDAPRPDGWYHQVPRDGPGHGLWRLAEWFSSGGNNFPRIHEHNQLDDDTVAPGGGVVIPRSILRPAFLALLPPVEENDDEEEVAEVPERDTSVPLGAPPAGADYTYERDSDADYLVYRLRRGEALYSAVVIRFTGNTRAKYVNAIASELQQLNGFVDLTDLEIGQPVKVPFDILLPEFLPASDPRRVEYETDLTESAKYSNTVRTSTLEGITVILDAGHGGADPGSKPDNVWESVHVYDIMLRVRRMLLEKTAARVETTTRDGRDYTIVNRDELPRSTGHVILTNPPYKIGDTKVGVNLRWYLANSLHRKAVKKSGDAQKTVFISIHADYLHSSVRGIMAYIPAASLTKGPYRKYGTVYETRAEVKEEATVNFSWKERTQSEGLSRQLAERIVDAFRRDSLAVHKDKAIRDRVVRCRGCRAWVPAVVRRNAVPAKLLLEVGNLNNSTDRRLLQTRDHRERVAQAIVNGILTYYGQSLEKR